MDTISEVNELLDKLKVSRNLAAAAREEKRLLVENVQQSDAYEKLDVITRREDEAITRLENEIRDKALSLHELCAELPERVAVKMFTVIDPYDEQKAKEWSLSHFTPAIKLDTKVFEKAVKDGNIPVELATTHKEARAQIATKL